MQINWDKEDSVPIQLFHLAQIVKNLEELDIDDGQNIKYIDTRVDDIVSILVNLIQSLMDIRKGNTVNLSTFKKHWSLIVVQLSQNNMTLIGWMNGQKGGIKLLISGKHILI